METKATCCLFDRQDADIRAFAARRLALPGSGLCAIAAIREVTERLAARPETLAAAAHGITW
jgi:hypothetical protein